MSMTVKKGDNVLVIAGKDKGKTGKVLEVFPKDNRVLVDGVNIVTKHKKARTQQEKSEIIKKTAPIEASNVMVICGTCGKATRVGHKEINGKKARVCKKCSASLDKEFVKATKKEAKKNIATAKAEEPAKTTAKTTAKKTSANPAGRKPATKTTAAKTTSVKKAAVNKTSGVRTVTQKSAKKTSSKG